MVAVAIHAVHLSGTDTSYLAAKVTPLHLPRAPRRALLSHDPALHGGCRVPQTIDWLAREVL